MNPRILLFIALVSLISCAEQKQTDSVHFGHDRFPFERYIEIHTKAVPLKLRVDWGTTNYKGKFFQNDTLVHVFYDWSFNTIFYLNDSCDKVVREFTSLLQSSNQNYAKFHALNLDTFVVTDMDDRKIYLITDKEILGEWSVHESCGIQAHLTFDNYVHFSRIGKKIAVCLMPRYGLPGINANKVFKRDGAFYTLDFKGDSLVMTSLGKKFNPVISRWKGDGMAIYDLPPKLLNLGPDEYLIFHSTTDSIKRIKCLAGDTIVEYLKVKNSEYDITPIVYPLNLGYVDVWEQVYNKALTNNFSKSNSTERIFRMVRPKNEDFESSEPDYRIMEILSPDFEVLSSYKIPYQYGPFTFVDNLHLLRYYNIDEGILRYELVD